MAELPLHGGANPTDRGVVPKTGLLVTNHMNMMFMLSAGLIMPPAGFGDKYYKDTLEVFPGWIPVFIGSPSRQAIEDSTAEERFLKPCIIKVNLSGFSGHAFAFGSGQLEEICFPEDFKDFHTFLLFPAPLPVSSIESIVFRSNDEKKTIEADARDYINVPLTKYKRGRNQGLFTKKACDIPWPAVDGLGAHSPPLQISFAAGGVMAILLHLANFSENSVHACQVAFSPDFGPSPTELDQVILSGLGSWISSGKATLPELTSPESDPTRLSGAVQAKLYWEAVERLVNWRGCHLEGTAESLITELLSEACSDLDGEPHEHVMKLNETLLAMTGLPEFTPGELLARHTATLDRAFIMFNLREKCDDLLDYDDDRLTESDWLAAAILFGVRDGWINLPTRLRLGQDLTKAVSHRMARLSHRVASTQFELGEIPPRVRPLRELFSGSSAWRSKEQEAALALARKEKWNCIRTRFTLRAGEYKLTVKGGSVQIELPGEPKVTPEIDKDEFFKLLAESHLDDKSAAPIRKMF